MHPCEITWFSSNQINYAELSDQLPIQLTHEVTFLIGKLNDKTKKKCIKDSIIAVSLSHCVFHKSSIILLFLGFHKQEVSIYSDNPLCSPSYNSIILRVNNCSSTSKLSYFNATIFKATILSSMDNKEKYDTSICMKK